MPPKEITLDTALWTAIILLSVFTIGAFLHIRGLRNERKKRIPTGEKRKKRSGKTVDFG